MLTVGRVGMTIWLVTKPGQERLKSHVWYVDSTWTVRFENQALDWSHLTGSRFSRQAENDGRFAKTVVILSDRALECPFDRDITHRANCV